MRVVRIFASLLAAFALNGAAAPVPAIIGTERLVLDSPPGFSDSLQLGSPRLQELAESLATASDRVLLFALTDADLRAFMSGDPPAFRRYMVIATPVRLEKERVDSALFATMVGDSMRAMGSAAGSDDYVKHLDTQPEGGPSLLAELRRDADVVSVLQGARLLVRASKFWESDKWRYILSTNTMFLLRGKVLQLVIYSNYEGKQDLEWIRSTTQRWLEELVRLNRR
jgi:hypothetical protein